MLDSLWKPLFRRAVIGRWQRLRMEGGDPPAPPANLHRPGLYLHIPFCRNLCPFCPYNRVPYDAELYTRFERAAHEEIDLIAPHLAGSEVVSLYVGGGTPTVNREGLIRLLDHLRSSFTITGGICIELHPANMNDGCLDRLQNAGVTQVSIGVQSSSDRLLARIGRNHDAATGLNAARRAANNGFEAVNGDLMFALPTQTLDEWDRDVHELLDCGVDQLSTYPLFSFPYSDLGKSEGLAKVPLPPKRRVRAMLDRADAIARQYGLQRCAVWSWARPGKKTFSSVTRHHYVGFGPSAGSMTGSHFYVNTFDVEAYADSLPKRRPIALAMPVDRRLEMVYWLYWRMYELVASDRDFRELFGDGASLTKTFGRLLRPFCWAGWLTRRDGEYRVTHAGAFHIHRLQNDYSLDYIDSLWGRCRKEPWPDAVEL